MAVIEARDGNFAQEVLNADKPVLVDFWAEWCMPCRMMAPVVDQIAEEHPEIKVVKLNVDENPLIASTYRIMSIPTLGIFKDGKMVDKVIGVTPKQHLLNKILQYVD
ncbi:thioredoxin [Caldanaerobius fijiensis DSM 17918]|uniref:Thioredoxin n=1 Tax=Caldanaerobius fijiensis DSM 17918 TaxID=1121256 RepID=A0A1M5BDQ7_9THEO|nr:thioredoxin [Caldanaerobius fijiensis]SHF40659.1 thioredoxin [Caldanaerobius fijiensis DSM 17918]